MAYIKLNIDFGGLLEDIKLAGGNVESTASQVANECAKTMHNELVSECSASGIPSSISREIKDSVNATGGGNVYEVKVGWELGDYNPKSPSAGYKAIFLNYGTARRMAKKRVHRNINGVWVTLGPDRGSIAARGFIAKAKKGAAKKIKKTQKDALKQMLKELT